MLVPWSRIFQEHNYFWLWDKRRTTVIDAITNIQMHHNIHNKVFNTNKLEINLALILTGE